MRARLVSLRVLATVLMALPLAGFAGALLPDLQRGIAAFEAGQLDAAEEDLLPLARNGYTEAWVKLAALYRMRGTEEDLRLSAYWYRHALANGQGVRVELAKTLLNAGIADGEVDVLLHKAFENGHPDALHLRLRLYRTHPQLDTANEAPMLAELAAAGDRRDDVLEALRWYRDNDEHERSVELCRTWQKAFDHCYEVLARHWRALDDGDALKALVDDAAKRYAAGRLTAAPIESIAHALTVTNAPGPRNPETAYNLLASIEDVSATAPTAMAELLIDDPSLDPERSPQNMLERAHAQGEPDAAFHLALLHLDPDSPQADPRKAESLLQEASATDIRADYYLGRLYDRGYLGRGDAGRALAHYLKAARAGYAKADLDLARLYSSNRGARVDPVNAYCFALLAEHAGVPGARELLEQLSGTVLPEQIEQARRKADAEYLARQAAVPDTGDAPSQLATAGEQTR